MTGNGKRGKPSRPFGPAILALTREIIGATVPQIMRIVALVDAMIRRGPADELIEPLRQRLARLRPPRPLRFDRLLFFPLDLLIVPTTFWRPGDHVLPRSALMPMAEHVRLTMADAAAAIGEEIAGCTTGDSELISRLGRSLWPAAARILSVTAMPDTWDTAELGDVAYRPLVGIVATLLNEAAGVDTLRAEAATGLLPVEQDAVTAILTRVARANQAALPMMVAVLLEHLPDAAGLLPVTAGGPAAATDADNAVDAGIDLLLRQLDRDEGVERRIAAGTLAEAGAAAGRIATLLAHLEAANPKAARRDLLRVVRQRLDAGCRERFASGMRDELMALLEQPGRPLDAACIDALEPAARGLRVLESAGRAVGGGPGYDDLLDKAAQAIKGSPMRDRLALVDRSRLVEILCGSEVALAMLDQVG